VGRHVACTGEARSVKDGSLMKELCMCVCVCVYIYIYVCIWENNIEMNCNVSVLNGLIVFRIGFSGRFL
jgi:hypothetical protein